MECILKELKAITMKHKGGLLSFWGRQPTQKAVPLTKSSVPEISSVVEIAVAGDPNEAKKNASERGTSASCNSLSVKPKAIVQEQLQLQINVIHADLVGLYARKTAGILTDEQQRELSDKKKVEELGSVLKKKKDDKKDHSSSEMRERRNSLLPLQNIQS